MTEVLTFGCRLNAYESQIMRDHARKAGLDDAVIINTCAVTKEAERQARQAIRRARRHNPDARIVVAGCAAQLDPDRFATMPEVDLVLGNHEKLEIESYANEEAHVLVDDIMSARETASHLIEGFDGRARAFIQVQQGCDHRCTFCIIPFARGPNRSVPIGALVEQVRTLVERGFREVVLTGVDITDYGKDLPGRPSLGQMTRRLLALVPDLDRLRLSSLDPGEVDPDLIDLIAEEPRLMPHFHLSVQSGDDLILKRMKRRHDRRDILDFCSRVRRLRPEAAFGADLIAGFPTESDEMFDRTVALIDECNFVYLHVFPYSERPDTPAARMPQVPMALRRDRAQRLRAQGERRLAAFLDSRIGSNARVLAEKERHGRCPSYAPVSLDRDVAPGTIVDVALDRREGVTLEGRVLP